MVDNPILNNPYDEPQYHYTMGIDGSLDYTQIVKGRRLHVPDVAPIPVRQGNQKQIWEVNDLEVEYGQLLVNLVRKELKIWREGGYGKVTRVTSELLNYWFLNDERTPDKKLFFAQREAVETAIWINEVAGQSNSGQNILNRLREAQTIGQTESENLPRIAFKMATGSGKTVVMAALILYHYFNRREYRNDPRFADNFLIVAPGITIKDRLGVLYVDTVNRSAESVTDYYHQRWLVPQRLEKAIEGLNAKLVITNYHSFEPRTLQGNKRSPLDGKIGFDGKKKQETESFNQVAKRLFGKFRAGSRLLVINDEAHHCYKPREKGKRTEEGDSEEENRRAAVWFSGLSELASRFKISAVYDLSATPYFLHGSGYPAYQLFNWLVTDFGLIEAIESGLVKIPFLPHKDNTQELDRAKLSNLYDHVRNDLPKKGQEKLKSEARKKGEKLREHAPRLPDLVKLALDQFYTDYEASYHSRNKKKGEQLSITDSPPVFIVVCNNTTVSREVYKFIAGYDIFDEKGEWVRSVSGHYPLFNNYEDSTGRALKRPPTLLIDSDALEYSDQVNDDFKKVFASEIENFKAEFRHRHPDKSVENITDADILREVVNTVGKQNALGSHVRCVVSVSMLTEGWDANTVTHIMGLRAFGSQLLCEQVAGRALRRRNYFLQDYTLKDDKGKPRKVQLFPPEYASIIGVPFRLFPPGNETPPQPPVPATRIFAIPERQEKFEITFPNIIGYREETKEAALSFDFSKVSNFELDGSRLPTTTTMLTAFNDEESKLSVEQVRHLRRQTIVYALTKEMILRFFSDDDAEAAPQFGRFNQIKQMVEHWYDHKIYCIGDTFPQMVYYADPKKVTQHIYQGVVAANNGTRTVLPVFNHYNRFGSSKYVCGHTTKPVYATTKSHVNYVVADTQSWEQIAAKTLEELPEVVSYVKNAFLGFAIPYVNGNRDQQYFPDFIARCKGKDGSMFSLIVEITGMAREKAEKKFYTENFWLPAVNAVQEQYGFDRWYFIEVANDIRDIRNQLRDRIAGIARQQEKAKTGAAQ